MRSLLWFLALSLAICCQSHARGGLIVTSMDTATPVVTFSFPARGVVGEGGYVGPNTVSFDGGPAISAYCTDFFRSIGVNDQYAADLAPASGLANADLVARVLAADAASGDNSFLEKAAVQLAVWDAIESGRAGLGGVLDPLALSGPNVDRGPDHFSVYADNAKIFEAPLRREQRRPPHRRAGRLGRPRPDGRPLRGGQQLLDDGRRPHLLRAVDRLRPGFRGAATGPHRDAGRARAVVADPRGHRPCRSLRPPVDAAPLRRQAA